jgi:CheY-like chemotaxis protein
VLDLMMPDVDGFQVLERLRADPRTQHVPVVVFTAKELSLEEKRWLTMQSAALLRKAPHVAEDLVAALLRAVPVGGTSSANGASSMVAPINPPLLPRAG